jgi:hypothetical protein
VRQMIAGPIVVSFSRKWKTFGLTSKNLQP